MRAFSVAVALAISALLVVAAGAAPQQGALGAVSSTTTTLLAVSAGPTTPVPIPPTTTTTSTTTTVVPTTTTSTSTTLPPKSSAVTTSPSTTRPPAPAPTATTTTSTVGAVTPRFDGPFASSLLTLANAARANAGLGSLQRSPALAAHAESWARRLGDLGSLSHSNFGALLGDDWKTVGENLAMGHRNASTMHKAWMASSAHRANILNPDFSHVGIAVWINASGTTWGVEVFGG